jgi:hypothetical protein
VDPLDAFANQYHQWCYPVRVRESPKNLVKGDRQKAQQEAPAETEHF